MPSYNYGVAEAVALPVGYTAIAYADKDGTAYAITGTVAANSNGTYVYTPSVADMQCKVLHIVASRTGYPNADAWVEVENYLTPTWATALSTAATTIAGWVTNGVTLATGAISSVWNALTSSMTTTGSVGKALVTLLGWTPGQVTGYATNQDPGTALTNQGYTTTRATKLDYLTANAATQTQATSILSAIAALPQSITPPDNTDIATILTDVQSIMSSIAAVETSADMATKYAALLAAISNVTTSLETNLDSSIAAILADVVTLLGDVSGLPTASSIATAVWSAATRTITSGGISQSDVVTALGTYGAATASEITPVQNGVNQLISTVGNGSKITNNSSVGVGGFITIISGDTYDLTGQQGRVLPIPVSLTNNALNLSAATYTLTLPGLPAISIPAPAINTTTQTATFTVGLTSAQTTALTHGTGQYSIVASWGPGVQSSVVYEGECLVK